MAKLKVENKFNYFSEKNIRAVKAKVTKPQKCQKPYRLTMCGWDNIRRANNPNKVLSHNALKVLTNIIFRLKRDKVVTMNHTYLTDNLTRCKYEQNNNILDELKAVLDIKFNRKGIINGKRYRDRFEIKANENTYKILENPELFYQQKIEIIEDKNTDKIFEKAKLTYLPENVSNPLKNSDTTRKKFSELSEFIQTPIYKKNTKRDKEERPKSFSSLSLKKEKEKEKKEEIEIKTPKSSLLCYEAASNPSCLSLKSETEAKSRDEARKSESRPLAKVIPLTAAMEKRLYLERLNRFNENDKSEDTNAFMSVAGILDQIQVQEQTQEQEVNTTETATLAPMMTVDHAKELTQLPQENCGTEKSYPDLKGAITTIESTDQTIDQTTANNQEENNMSIPLKTTDNPLWNEIRQKALASTDDEWDLKYDLNQLEMIERNLDKPLRGLNGIEIRKEFEFRGSAFVIKNLKRKHFKIFTESIHALAPNHTFTFTEI